LVRGLNLVNVDEILKMAAERAVAVEVYRLLPIDEAHKWYG